MEKRRRRSCDRERIAKNGYVAEKFTFKNIQLPCVMIMETTPGNIFRREEGN
jgi:hypothetical protein